MAEQIVRLTFPARAEYLLLARLALAGLARNLRVDQEALADLKLAVTEACGNAVRHAYRGGDGAVAVVFALEGDRFDMIVEDEGAGIGSVPSPEAQPALEGGMGMAIIQAVVDELDIREGRDGRGTSVRMTKHLPISGSELVSQ